MYHRDVIYWVIGTVAGFLRLSQTKRLAVFAAVGWHGWLAQPCDRAAGEARSGSPGALTSGPLMQCEEGEPVKRVQHRGADAREAGTGDV